MKTQSVHLGEFPVARNFTFCQPALVGKGEFQLVAIKFGVGSAQDERYFRQLNFPDSCQVVHHLLLFESDLFLIWQHLPFAAAAGAEIFAKRFDAVFRLFGKPDNPAFGKTAPFACELNIDHIARNDKRHENGHAVHFRDRFAFGRHINYFNILQNG